jgi:hypothetical protein
MIPHLIHIGYPKTGSNLVRKWFDQHPQIAFAKGGIAGFSDVYDLGRPSVDRHARIRVTSAEGLATPHNGFGSDIAYDLGEPVSIQDRQTQICQRLGELFPNARILMVTRGFRSLMLSSYSQRIRMGGVEGFEDLFAPAQEQVSPEEQPWDYDFMLDVYEQVFGRGQVLVMPYELLRDDPAAFFGALEGSLDLDAHPVPADRINPALTGAELHWYPRISLAVSKLPLGRLRSPIQRRYVKSLNAGRLHGLALLLQRLRPGRLLSEADLTEAMVVRVSGKAERLRDNPLYGPYLADYRL